jgi:hypothetical protein
MSPGSLLLRDETGGCARQSGSGGPIWDLFSPARGENSARLNQPERARAEASHSPAAYGLANALRV